MYANCGSQNARCSVYKVEIISLAFKWLIVLRSAIETRDQTHRVLKPAYKRMFTRLARSLTTYTQSVHTDLTDERQDEEKILI